MSAQPLVSVIVGAYNAESYIEAALASALEQTHRHLEVLVVDDGSTDATPDLLDRIAAADHRVRVFHQPNQGIAAARNAALAHARGTYFAPLDADDIWHPEKIERQVRRMEAGGERMGLVYSWWTSLDAEGVLRSASHPWRLEGDVHAALFFMNFIGNASVPLYRRTVLDHVGGFNASLRARGGQGCEDWDLALRVAAAYDVGVAPGYLIGYRGVTGSMSRDTVAMARSYDLVAESVREAHPDLLARVRRWSRGHFRMYLAGVSRAEGAYGRIPRWLFEAALADPILITSRFFSILLIESLLWTVGKPLAQRLWPTPEAWRSFKRRQAFSLRPDASRLRETVTSWGDERGEVQELPWRLDRYHGRLQIRRWQAVVQMRSRPRHPPRPIPDQAACEERGGANRQAPRTGEEGEPPR